MSKSVYQKIKEQKLLSESCFAVYDALKTVGPMTAGEIVLELGYRMPRNNAAGRLAEMNAMGVVKKVGSRMCNTSGKTCSEWTVTNKMPKEPKPLRSFWIVENSKTRKIYVDESAARSYQKKVGGNVILVAERRKSK